MDAEDFATNIIQYLVHKNKKRRKKEDQNAAIQIMVFDLLVTYHASVTFSFIIDPAIDKNQTPKPSPSDPPAILSA